MIFLEIGAGKNGGVNEISITRVSWKCNDIVKVTNAEVKYVCNVTKDIIYSLVDFSSASCSLLGGFQYMAERSVSFCLSFFLFLFHSLFPFNIELCCSFQVPSSMVSFYISKQP